MFQVRCVQGAWPLENKCFSHQSSPSRRDLIWWEWGVCKCTSVQKEHQDECLSWPYRQQLSTTTTHNIMSFRQETITNTSGALLDDSPCCLVLDGTGMLLNSFTSLTLSTERQKCEGGAAHIWAVWQTKMWLTSCLSWVWRCTVSVFHCREEWTSSDGTWEDMQSGPVGSECWQSGGTTVCRKCENTSFFRVSNFTCGLFCSS